MVCVRCWQKNKLIRCERMNERMNLLKWAHCGECFLHFLISTFIHQIVKLVGGELCQQFGSTTDLIDPLFSSLPGLVAQTILTRNLGGTLSPSFEICTDFELEGVEKGAYIYFVCSPKRQRPLKSYIEPILELEPFERLVQKEFLIVQVYLLFSLTLHEKT